MSTKIRVVIVDDEELARKRINELLGRLDDVECVGEAANCHFHIVLFLRICTR